jgi:hypothetical protein
VDKSVVLIHAHFDSRCEGSCDLTCNAFGIEDNATGTALVLELARVMSKYSFKNTILFSLNTAEEQGKYGAEAMARYFNTNSIKLKASNNNDVSGGIFCGYTSSAPSCPTYGHIDSVGLRIFSFGGFNSIHKQWARYIKLQYKEQLKTLVPVFTDIRIMSAEDRTGRGGDHQPLRQLYNYTAVRFTAANENGDASNGGGYVDRQHSVRDSLGKDLNSDGIEDSLYVSQYYLARNALVNGNSMAMAALSPDTITMVASLAGSNKVRVQFSGSASPSYRVAVRSLTDDWDSVYTITGKTLDTILVPYLSNTSFFISASAMNSSNVESLFSSEYSLTLNLVTLALHEPASSVKKKKMQDIYGIRLLQNQPNPFDENTRITIMSGTDMFVNRTWIIIRQQDGTIVKKIKVPLKKGITEVDYTHGFTATGTYVYSLVIDGLPVETRKMVFGAQR